ncbi:DUF413 domain-containing protein [Vibrio sinaloensis]|uniref:DUF413 domain-containing protein n=1 Tax=Photobacterium sp. (strain ATCC 43367) TaxID=379097 RepID=UPI0022B04235|nr:DUF413 domain-containing protein [Vibrio sinaloensis]MCZ4292523.1 DUF413 domain-containing protein [Vibrio sinaloensis]
MSFQEIRQGKTHFYDNVHFSRGFSKSGDFTLAEDELLTFYGKTLLGLESGELTPENQAESDFLDVIQGKKEPTTKLERTWMKYIKLARGKKRFHTLNSKPTVSDDDYNSYDLVEDD